jgi:hypothetical protein
VSAQEPRYGPQTDEERAANEQAVREAVEAITLSYLGRDGRGRPRNRRLRELEDRAALLARYYARQDQKGPRL